MSFNLIGIDEDLPVKHHHDVYETIDPKVHFTNKTYAGKIVLITGASDGIGRELAVHYAKAGASLALVARRAAMLEETKAAVLKAAPTTDVLLFPSDVTDASAAEATVKKTIDYFGKLDILVPNAGIATFFKDRVGEKDPTDWWRTFEVNIRGTFNYVHPALPELENNGGYILAISTLAAQIRVPFASDYNISRHALGRFIEYLGIEYPDIKVFALHPGAIDTPGAAAFAPDFPKTETIALPAAAALYLTSGKLDWLSGKYVAATWDFAELEKDWKAKILEKNGLVNKLYIPA